MIVPQVLLVLQSKIYNGGMSQNLICHCYDLVGCQNLGVFFVCFLVLWVFLVAVVLVFSTKEALLFLMK